MGDHAVNAAAPSAEAATVSIPPRVLARWAALASTRAYFAVLPQQPPRI